MWLAMSDQPSPIQDRDAVAKGGGVVEVVQSDGTGRSEAAQQAELVAYVELVRRLVEQISRGFWVRARATWTPRVPISARGGTGDGRGPSRSGRQLRRWYPGRHRAP